MLQDMSSYTITTASGVLLGLKELEIRAEISLVSYVRRTELKESYELRCTTKSRWRNCNMTSDSVRVQVYCEMFLYSMPGARKEIQIKYDMKFQKLLR